MILPGIHHVTAIAGDARRNLAFYRDLLGLRLVKLTVNFDDPSSYHLYYGDASGAPGTILTFFAGEGAYPGRVGSSQVSEIALAVPDLDRWARQLDRPITERFGERGLALTDPDGLPLRLVESAGPPGVHSVTLDVRGSSPTLALLTEQLGFAPQEREGSRQRLRAGGDFASLVDVVDSQTPIGRMGSGAVHHLALRVPDDEQQLAWQARLEESGIPVSPVRDRTYFHSIYFREPGGVLLEIATDQPGFTVDQPLEELGTRLVLPSWLEPHRARVESLLPPLEVDALKA